MGWTTAEADEIREIHEAVTTIAAGCKPCRAEVADHRLMLNGPPGNGTRPGLRSRVDSHDEEIATIEKEIGTIVGKYHFAVTWALRIVGGVIASAIGAFIVWKIN